MRVPIPTNEAERLSFLQNLRLDLSHPIDEIQGLCEVASNLADAPIALVSLIDETQQNFLASIGVGDLRQTDREIAMCAHAIMGSQQFEVPDALLDERFSDNPFVVDAPNIRSYLGTVLEPEPEMRLGTLCVLDIKPKVYSDEVKLSLSKIGKAITALLISHREKLDLVEHSRELEARNLELGEMTSSLQSSMEKVIAAERAKSEFLAIVSHELRTPLTSIKGALGLMKGNAINADVEKTQRLINIAYENSERLLNLIGDILTLQKENFSSPKAVLNPVDLATLIKSSAIAYQDYAADRAVKLSVSGVEQPCFVNGDKTQLDQVIANMLSNAFKFSKPNGNVEIGLHCLDTGPQITVKDDGAGIPEGSKAKVFGLFSQVDSSDTRSQAGSGLGMHICQKILEQHNATIDYESVLGAGTTFKVKFPPRRI
ncbi:GAF domain-containing sensor histidine kinase [Pacificibacter marinus]|uniref:histidine kinase n=1 Tax=Pacificibacter marinus TaxID=658057 RepID=A0A1Y5RRK9_9RHOB|nr:GAF domain-containing sensor histidine kinase [Pacificibacter marinus]SEK43915.1 Signal transduction histidine kinase [Pacificibacter marinus]SLN23429.1 Sensor protein EvgS precursor [Pacificibacter marinus]